MDTHSISSPDPKQTPEDETALSDSDRGNLEIPPPRNRQHRRAGTAISWLLILAAVATTQIPQYRRNRQDRQSQQPGVTQDLTLQLMGRYVVGMKSILGNTSAVNLSIQQFRNMLKNSNNPGKHLLLIPIVMELTSRDEALAELKPLLSEPSNGSVAMDASVFLQLYQKGSSSLTQEQHRAIERYGWIGKLALSQDKPPSDPVRRSVIRSALQTFVTAVAFIMGVLAALAAGLILFIIAVVFLAQKRLHGRFSPPQGPGASLLEGFAIFITGLIGLPALARWILPEYQLITSLFTLPAILIALAWPYLQGSKWKDMRTAFGWHRGWDSEC